MPHFGGCAKNILLTRGLAWSELRAWEPVAPPRNHRVILLTPIVPEVAFDITPHAAVPASIDDRQDDQRQNQ